MAHVATDIAVAVVIAVTISGGVAYGTAIGAVGDDAGFYIAAESRQLRADNAVVSDGCKLRVSGDVVFAAAGLLHNDAAGWDVFETISEALKGPPASLQTIAERIIIAAAVPLQTAYTETLSAFPDTTDLVTTLILARPQGRSAEVFKIDFATAVPVYPFTLTLKMGVFPSHFGCAYIGNKKCTEAYYAAHPSGDPETLVRGYLEHEVGEGHFDIGGPIDMLRIKDGKISWLKQKPMCGWGLHLIRFGFR